MRLTSVTTIWLTLLVWAAQSSAASAVGSVSDTGPEVAAASLVQAFNRRNESAAADFLDMAALGARAGETMTTNPAEQRQMDKAMQCVLTIERRVGSDGITNLLKANINMMTGAYAQGAALARQAIQLEPDLQDAYYTLAVNYVGLEQYPQAIAVYQSIATRFKVKFQRQRFEREPRFAGLVQSADFQKWMPAPGS